MQNQNDPQKGKIEIINVQNSLKKRAVGIHRKESDQGFIDPELIEAAEKEITKSCSTCQDIIYKNYQELIIVWKGLRASQTSMTKKEAFEKLFLIAHEIKDISSICGYDLIAYFAESLRDFINKTDLTDKAQTIIIQAHIDAIQALQDLNIKTDDGGKTNELKNMVQKAIDQNT